MHSCVYNCFHKKLSYFICYILVFVQGQLSEFLNTKFSSLTSSAKMLEMLERFEKLNLPSLSASITSKYEAAMILFMDEIELVRQV